MGDIPEQAIFVIVFLIIGAIRWVLEQRASAKRPPLENSYEEPVFLDRAAPYVGESSSNDLDELYTQARREIQERQNRATPTQEEISNKLRGYQPQERVPPPLPEKPLELQRVKPEAAAKAQAEAPTPYQLKKVRRPTLSAAQQQAIVDFERLGAKKKVDSASTSRVRDLLAGPSAARDAIVLSEILGKPKGV